MLIRGVDPQWAAGSVLCRALVESPRNTLAPGLAHEVGGAPRGARGIVEAPDLRQGRGERLEETGLGLSRPAPQLACDPEGLGAVAQPRVRMGGEQCGEL